MSSGSGGTLGPAYAAATLLYGVTVDAYSLIWAARVWRAHRASWDLLNGVESRIKCAHSLRTDGHCSIADLPTEIVNRIKHELWVCTRPQAECTAWMLFGDEGVEQYHPRYCCGEPPEDMMEPEADWPPGLIAEKFQSARDEIIDHFSFEVPRCDLPCSAHFLCQVIHDYLKSWQLCLADCSFEDDAEGDDHHQQQRRCRPTNWIITSSDPEKQNDIPQFSHHLNLITNNQNQPTRKIVNVEEDWQEKELSRKESFIRFLKDSGVEQPAGVFKEPGFYLVCIGQRNVF